jgi:16S rRNA (adenine1518-N6/adenine1519-N6)-dimethyltransferase
LSRNIKITHHPKKSLGQNYLHDENICRNIVSAFETKNDDFVIEIGAGKGALTKYLTEPTRNLAVIELDKNNCDVLKETFPGLKIINEDVLNVNFQELSNSFGKKKSKLRIIGNIPYNITSPILFKLIDNRQVICDAQLMIQEEVAKRLTAKPNTKDYGILSVFTQVYTKPKLLFKVSKNCFYPKPKVDSRVIKLEFTDELVSKINNEDFFRKFVRGAFGTRRKTLRNSLKNIGIDINELIIDFDFNRRAENLSVMEFIELSNGIYNRALSFPRKRESESM